MANQILDIQSTSAELSDAPALSSGINRPAHQATPQLTHSHRSQDAKFLQRLLESSQDCIKVLDLQGRLLYMNHEGQRVMEIDDFAKQVQHQPWLSFWHGAEHDAAKAAFEQACNGNTGHFDGYCATAKGSPKWWEVVVTPIFDDDRQIREVLSVSRDITARKKAEETIQQRNQELDSFTRTVSHDLKAPLRGISSLASWIEEDLEGIASEETQSHLALLQHRLFKMQSLIDGLLEVSRVGREEIADEEVDTAELLEEIIDSLAPPEGMSVLPSSPLPKFIVKRLLLKQVLTNLLSNAVKHHDKEIGKVEIAIADQQHQYEFAIADDGPGIPPSYHEKIFEMFQTLSSDESSANTGIGLALVKKIVEGEGGKLWLDKTISTGSRFCFTWPKKASQSANTSL